MKCDKTGTKGFIIPVGIMILAKFASLAVLKVAACVAGTDAQEAHGGPVNRAQVWFAYKPALCTGVPTVRPRSAC